MKFVLSIACDTAAFEQDDVTAEVARILREAASNLASGIEPGSLRDANGNTVGSAVFVKEPKPEYRHQHNPLGEG